MQSMVIALRQPIAVPPVGLPPTVRPTQRILIPGNWEQFELVQKGFGESKCVRLSYYDGTIEIIMPGLAHELFKTVIALLLEAYLLDRDLEFMPMGSMTQKAEKIASAEADESYEIGGLRLSIEVTVTHGDTSKLLTYKALGIDEVWFWEDGILEFYHLVEDDYTCVDRSQIPELSGIDRAVLTNCVLMGETSRVQAMRAFRSAHPL
jgi:Uma2 family endonuclease